MIEPYVQKTWEELEALDSQSVLLAVKAAGKEIHTFSGQGGCDVSTDSVLKSIEEHGARRGNDEYIFMAMGVRHGHEVAIIDQFGRIILIKLKVDSLPGPELPAGYQEHASTRVGHYFPGGSTVSVCKRETRVNDREVKAEPSFMACSHCVKAMERQAQEITE